MTFEASSGTGVVRSPAPAGRGRREAHGRRLHERGILRAQRKDHSRLTWMDRFREDIPAPGRRQAGDRGPGADGRVVREAPAPCGCLHNVCVTAPPDRTRRSAPKQLACPYTTWTYASTAPSRPTPGSTGTKGRQPPCHVVRTAYGLVPCAPQPPPGTTGSSSIRRTPRRLSARAHRATLVGRI